MWKRYTILVSVLAVALTAFHACVAAEDSKSSDSPDGNKAGALAFFRIPIRLQPLDAQVNVIAKGSQWNKMIDFASLGDSAKAGSSGKDGAPVVKPGTPLPPAVSFPDDNVLQLADPSVAGVVLDEAGADSSALLFPKGWSFSLGALHGRPEFFFAGKKEVSLVKVGDGTRYGFMPTSDVTVELHGVDIPAVLRLRRQSYPAANNPIRLNQARAPSGGTVDYEFSGGIANDPSTTLSVIFIEESDRAGAAVRSVESIRPRAEGVSGV